jgi:hypothetical protein
MIQELSRLNRFKNSNYQAVVVHSRHLDIMNNTQTSKLYVINAEVAGYAAI